MKQKDCDEVNSWIKSISNHLYWCAASTEGHDGDMVLSKWKSVANHIQNVHSGHEGPYDTCQHEELTDRKWFKPGKKKFISLINSYMFFIGGIILVCEHVTSIKKRDMLLEPDVLTVSSSIRSNYRLLPTSMYTTCKYMYNKQMYVL